VEEAQVKRERTVGVRRKTGGVKGKRPAVEVVRKGVGWRLKGERGKKGEGGERYEDFFSRSNFSWKKRWGDRAGIPARERVRQ